MKTAHGGQQNFIKHPAKRGGKECYSESDVSKRGFIIGSVDRSSFFSNPMINKAETGKEIQEKEKERTAITAITK